LDAFSYLSVLLSIILGLAITQVLLGLRSLMHARSRVRM
jgi:heme/copper-type cytochrome/quinol oxidase subunit 4